MAGAVNYVIGASGHPGGTWTIQNTNTAQTGRFHDLLLLAEGASGSNEFTQSRTGVLSGPADASSNVPTGMLASASGSGLNINVRPGAAAVERSTLVGPYGVVSEATAGVTLATADATNSRWDRIDLQVLDGVLGDNSGTSQTAFVVTTGTPSGTPVLPSAPTNSMPISKILLPAGATTVTAGMMTDLRKSSSLRGALRVMLPGDSGESGFSHGELRDTGGTATQPRIDRYNNVTGNWETLVLTGVGAGYAKYTAAVTATGASQNLPASATTLVQFINAVRTCPDVSASGTNNNAFTLNRAGQWAIKGGIRVLMGATETIFYQIADATTGLIIAAGVDFSAASGNTLDRTFGGDDYFAAGDVINMNFILGSGTACAIGSGSVPTGYRTWISFKWLGP